MNEKRLFKESDEQMDKLIAAFEKKVACAPLSTPYAALCLLTTTMINIVKSIEGISTPEAYRFVATVFSLHADDVEKYYEATLKDAEQVGLRLLAALVHDHASARRHAR